MAFKMKGWKAFTTKDNSNNRPDGRAGSSAFQKNGDVRRINKAKKITRKHVKHNTVDSPSYGETTPRQQRKAERKLTRADKKLQKAGYSIEQREEATGAAGYNTAMDWATEPMVTKKDKAKKAPMKKTIAKNAGVEPLKPTDKEKKMNEAKKGLKTAMMEGGAEAATQAMKPKMRKIEKRITKPNPNIYTGPRDFEPAWEGADISEKKWNSMTKKEQKAYTERYGD